MIIFIGLEALYCGYSVLFSGYSGLIISLHHSTVASSGSSGLFQPFYKENLGQRAKVANPR